MDAVQGSEGGGEMAELRALEVAEEGAEPVAMEEESDADCIGIDLGTTNLCVAVYKRHLDQVEVIPNKGSRTTPSVVELEGEVMKVGHEATRRDPILTATQTKRVIGLEWAKAQQEMDRLKLLYQLVEEEEGNGVTAVKLGEKTLSPEEIAAECLKQCKKMAEDFLNHPVKKAVITVPAYFNHRRRLATRHAASFAGLEVVQLINEPTAASLAYAFCSTVAIGGEGLTLLIFDLGGGTFDVTVLRLCEGVVRVLASTGNDHIGGEDVTTALLQHVLGEVEKSTGTRPKRAPLLKKLRAECEAAKKTLAHSESAVLTYSTDEADINIPITRELLAALMRDMLVECLALVDQAMREAKHAPAEINKVILVGGSTYASCVRQLLESKFGAEKVDTSINADEAVAIGAALQCAIASRSTAETSRLRSFLVHDVLSMTLGAHMHGNIMSRALVRGTLLPGFGVLTKIGTHDPSKDYAFLKIYEGESMVSVDNLLLGKIKVLFPLVRPQQSMDILFRMDALGGLHIRAYDTLSDFASHALTIRMDWSKALESDGQVAILGASDAEMKLDHLAYNFWRVTNGKEAIASLQVIPWSLPLPPPQPEPVEEIGEENDDQQQSFVSSVAAAAIVPKEEPQNTPSAVQEEESGDAEKLVIGGGVPSSSSSKGLSWLALPTSVRHNPESMSDDETYVYLSVRDQRKGKESRLVKASAIPAETNTAPKSPPPAKPSYSFRVRRPLSTMEARQKPAVAPKKPKVAKKPKSGERSKADTKRANTHPPEANSSQEENILTAKAASDEGGDDGILKLGTFIEHFKCGAGQGGSQQKASGKGLPADEATGAGPLHYEEVSESEDGDEEDEEEDEGEEEKEGGPRWMGEDEEDE